MRGCYYYYRVVSNDAVANGDRRRSYLDVPIDLQFMIVLRKRVLSIRGRVYYLIQRELVCRPRAKNMPLEESRAYLLVDVKSLDHHQLFRMCRRGYLWIHG